MKLLGKEVKINIDIEFGLFEDIQKKPEDASVMKKFVSALTGLPLKDVRRLKMSQIQNIMAKFRELQEKETRESKKNYLYRKSRNTRY